MVNGKLEKQFMFDWTWERKTYVGHGSKIPIFYGKEKLEHIKVTFRWAGNWDNFFFTKVPLSF